MQHLKAEDEAIIRARAYQYWEDEGRPEDRDKIHWQRALESCKVPDMMPKIAPQIATVSAITDVSLIDGIGPKISVLLEEAGITTLQQIAAMSEDDITALDEKLNLKGRSQREEWIAQAQELIMGHAPRAKIDQDRADNR
jgi:predicted flap endonuclease-1-like 5' DNA nuclease